MTDFFEEDIEATETFKIDTDALADWALKKIKEERAEATRIIQIGNDQIAEITMKQIAIRDQSENKCKYLLRLLSDYFNSVPHKETKTQESYKLLSGSLVMKKPTVKYERDEKAFSEWLTNNGYDEYLETVIKPKWADFKANIGIDEDGKIYDKQTGVFVDGVTATEVPASFDIK